MKTTISATATTNTIASSASGITPVVTIIPKTEVPDVPALQFPAPNSTAPVVSSNSAAAGNSKRPASLDLKAAVNAKKKQLLTPLMLDSPDLQNSKTLDTPDIEKILLSSTMMQTPQPGMVFPSKGDAVTSEQEAYVKGFEEALSNLHNSKNSQSTVGSTTSAANATATAPATTTAAGTGMSGGSFTYANMDNFPVAIKDEPQNPPASPTVNPIDMETQEKIKLERKRQRNRVAASKCRKRKLERISKLEDKVKQLKGENTDLGAMVKSLKDHVAQLKQQVIDHIGSGCTVPMLNEVSALLSNK